MNRFTFSLLLLLGGVGSANAQTLTLCQQVIGATGTSSVEQGLVYSYTVGETFTTTLRTTGTDVVLTQGFHQPEICLAVSTHTPTAFADWDIQVYPNPTAQYLTVQYANPQGHLLSASAVDQTGRILLADRPLSGIEVSQIDCALWPAGVYFLLLSDTQTKATATVRFVKL